MSWDLVKACTMAIATPSGEIRGTGFFISPEGHLLTCAHVVEDSGGWKQVRVNGQAVDLVYLGDRTYDDFAILQLSGYQGSSAPLSLNFQPMDRFLTIGYGRLDFPQGASIDGTITDINQQSEFGNLPMLRLRVKANSQQVQGGYSGSPVFDAETQKVTGLIAAYDNTEGALALPLQTVLEKWAKLSSFLNIHPDVPPLPPKSKSARVFISYRSQDPDLSLAQHFYEAIKAAGHQAFMAGESIRLGENWPQRIDRELEQCDYFLLLLSEKAATSEMVTEEVRRAKQLQDLRPEHKPVILPIRVNFPLSAPLNYDLRGYLSQIQQREWKSPADTPKILQEILSLLATDDVGNGLKTDVTDELSLRITDQASATSATTSVAASVATVAPPLPVAEPELPEGQVDLASAFYVERPPIESRCYEAIVKPGSLIRIKAPRQMGKTSLMARILHQASQQGCLTVPLSFQLADGKVFTNLDKFLQWFCASVGRRLRIPNKLGDYWDEIFGSKDNCTAYFEEYLLIDYLFNGDITQWLLGQGRTDLANVSRKIVSSHQQEKHKGLELFVRELCKSVGANPYPKIFLNPDTLNFGEIPVGYQTRIELQILNNGRGFAWGYVNVPPYLPGLIVPQKFDSSTSAFPIQLDTLIVKAGSYDDYIVIQLEGIREPYQIHLKYTIRKIEVRIAPSNLLLGDISNRINAISTLLNVICETSDGRIGGRIKGTVSNELTQLKVTPSSFEGALIDLLVNLDTTSLEAGRYEDVISLKTNAGQFSIIVNFNKRIRWDIITRYTIISAIGTAGFMCLTRTILVLLFGVANLWFLSYPNTKSHSASFSAFCSQNIDLAFFDKVFNNEHKITIQDIVLRSANIGLILTFLMILTIPQFRESIIKIIRIVVKYSNNIIHTSQIIIIIIILILLIKSYLIFLYGYIENFLSFAVLTVLIIMDLPAYSFIWISIKQPQLGWLLLGLLIGGMLGIILALLVIKQYSSIWRMSIIAIAMIFLLTFTGYFTAKYKHDSCYFKTNNQEYGTFPKALLTFE